ncbi:MAG: FAD-binding oxidoreductase, partial [Acidobacteria bacterium]|nr:FAD-binding oxidoreductase [Acidobacteriota bacterium]
MTTLTPEFVIGLRDLLGPAYVRTDEATRTAYGVDALKRGTPADVVVLPANTAEVAGVVKLC